jgi:hypothetical protein
MGFGGYGREKMWVLLTAAVGAFEALRALGGGGGEEDGEGGEDGMELHFCVNGLESKELVVVEDVDF